MSTIPYDKSSAVRDTASCKKVQSTAVKNERGIDQKSFITRLNIISETRIKIILTRKK